MWGSLPPSPYPAHFLLPFPLCLCVPHPSPCCTQGFTFSKHIFYNRAVLHDPIWTSKCKNFPKSCIAEYVKSSIISSLHFISLNACLRGNHLCCLFLFPPCVLTMPCVQYLSHMCVRLNCPRASSQCPNGKLLICSCPLHTCTGKSHLYLIKKKACGIADSHLSFYSSESNPPVSSPVLQQTTCCHLSSSLAPSPVITQVFSSKLPYPSSCFIPTPNSSMHSLGTCRLLQSGKQVG